MISDNLFRLRTAAGMSQEEVADAAGINRVSYTRYENGTRKPIASNIAKLARVFGVTTDSLMGIDPSENSDKKNPASINTDGLENELRELTAIWNHLSPEGRNELLRFAKFQEREHNQ